MTSGSETSNVSQGGGGEAGGTVGVGGGWTGNFDIMNCGIIDIACNGNNAVAIYSCRSSGSGTRAFFGDFTEAQGRPSSCIRAIPWPR